MQKAVFLSSVLIIALFFMSVLSFFAMAHQGSHNSNCAVSFVFNEKCPETKNLAKFADFHLGILKIFYSISSLVFICLLILSAFFAQSIKKFFIFIPSAKSRGRLIPRIYFQFLEKICKLSIINFIRWIFFQEKIYTTALIFELP